MWQTFGGVTRFLDRIAMELRFANDDSIKGRVASVVQYKLQQTIAKLRSCSLDVETKLLPLFAKNDFVTMGILDELNITLTAAEEGPTKFCAMSGQNILSHQLHQAWPSF